MRTWNHLMNRICAFEKIYWAWPTHKWRMSRISSSPRTLFGTNHWRIKFRTWKSKKGINRVTLNKCILSVFNILIFVREMLWFMNWDFGFFWCKGCCELFYWILLIRLITYYDASNPTIKFYKHIAACFKVSFVQYENKSMFIYLIRTREIELW